MIQFIYYYSDWVPNTVMDDRPAPLLCKVGFQHPVTKKIQFVTAKVDSGAQTTCLSFDMIKRFNLGRLKVFHKLILPNNVLTRGLS